MTTLYDIKDRYSELLSLDLPEDAIADTLEAIEGELEVKADKICHVIANIDSDCEAIDAEIKRLQARKKVLDNRKESLKDYLRTNMAAMDMKKIQTPLFTINRVAGRAMAVITDESKIPQQFQKVSVSIDKTLLLNALKEGKAVEGAELGESKESLRVK